jgi:hypothetical protein
VHRVGVDGFRDPRHHPQRVVCRRDEVEPTRFVRDPNTEKIVRPKRPRSEWIVRQDESLRIISDATFVQAPSKIRSNADRRLKAGGRLKYLLSVC